MTPDPDTWFRAEKGSLCWRPKIDLSHFTSWCCCPLPWPTPDADNSPSVSLCLLWREPRTSAQTHLKPPCSIFARALPLSASPRRSLLVFRLSDVLFLSNLPSSSRLPLYSCSPGSVSHPYLSLAAFTSLLLSLPRDQFTCAWPSPFFLTLRHCHGVFSSSSCSSVFSPCHSPALHLLAKPSRASANFQPHDSFQIQLNLRRFN